MKTSDSISNYGFSSFLWPAALSWSGVLPNVQGQLKRLQSTPTLPADWPVVGGGVEEGEGGWAGTAAWRPALPADGPVVGGGVEEGGGGQVGTAARRV